MEGVATIDIEQVMRMFSEFDAKKRKRVYRQATSKALNIVKKQTITNLKKVTSKIDKKDKWGNTLRKGITTKVYRDNKSGVIHILKNFKLKFFELGTKERYNIAKGSRRTGKLKKKRYTGRIQSYKFFTNAINSKRTEVFSSIDKLLSDSIKKINDKYKGKTQ